MSYKKLSLALAIIVVAFFLPSAASAHQPYIVTQNYITVSNPEISRAFYDELKGETRIYQIHSDKEFSLYLNLLVPKNTNPNGLYSAIISKIEKDLPVEIGTLNADDVVWQDFYEEYGNDYYKKGPEWKKTVPAGDYRVEVGNNDNSGKYVLAIGEIESFSFKDMGRTIKTVLELKKNFFNEPQYTILFSKFGKIFLAVSAVLLVVIIFLIYRFIIRKLLK